MSGRSRLRLGLGVVLALGLLFFFFKGMDFGKVWLALRSADPLLLSGAVAASVVTYLLRAWRWGSLLSPIVPVPFGDL
ncbi:MAG TPA: lysylphosphatidylglycerol synthase domain-containing protein, partial [Vicinamibacteria bacterium]